MMKAVKRVYDKPAKEDGMRILVDRLWPRGLTKQKAAIDLWMKDIAPSTELRKWFGHDPDKWIEFRKKGPVALVYGARDQEHNEALVLKELLDR